MFLDRTGFKRVLVLVLLLGCGMIHLAWGEPTDPEVREALQEILRLRSSGSLGDLLAPLGPNVPQIVIEMYPQDQNVFHRIRMIDVLGYFADSKAIEFLKQQSQSAESPYIRAEAIKSLSNSGGINSKEFISNFKKDSSRVVSLEASNAVSRLEASGQGAAKHRKSAASQTDRPRLHRLKH